MSQVCRAGSQLYSMKGCFRAKSEKIDLPLDYVYTPGIFMKDGGEYVQRAIPIDH
jgi:hypothetical protein